MKQVDGVGFIHDFVGSLLWAVFFYEDGRALSGRLERLREIAGAEGMFSHIPFPPCRASLTRPEFSLVLDLLEHGMESYGSLAKRHGVSVRTLQRRLSKLVREAAVVSVPRVDYRAIRGSVPADLWSSSTTSRPRGEPKGRFCRWWGTALSLRRSGTGLECAA